jgi:Protein of unknown function (DUF3152)
LESDGQLLLFYTSYCALHNAEGRVRRATGLWAGVLRGGLVWALAVLSACSGSEGAIVRERAAEPQARPATSQEHPADHTAGQTGTTKSVRRIRTSSLARTADMAETKEGFVFVKKRGPVVGDGTLRTYRLEVEPETGVDPRAFSDLAERILSDERGWTGTGDWALQRVTRRDVDIRVVLATPPTVDRLCAEVGLDTHGEVSCWNGRLAAINLDRWMTGADAFPRPLRTYRQYLLNHEVGHGLGYHHVSCPRPGARAPVMQQQTYATRPCKPNGWPMHDG